MRIIFMGTPAFSVPVLEGLVEKGYEVLAVVTQPDRAVGRKKEIKMTPVKEAALRHKLPVYQPLSCLSMYKRSILLRSSILHRFRQHCSG